MDQLELDDVCLIEGPIPIPASAIRHKTMNIIASLLNAEKAILKASNGCSRDYFGLAHLCNIPSELMSSVTLSQNPTLKILTLWCERETPEICTIQKLLTFLEELDRFDVVDDIQDSLKEDIEFFKKNPEGFKLLKPNDFVDENILTVDDVARYRAGLEPQSYDAFVLFADDDIDFATELIDTMEKQYGMKFCVKDRDLVSGGFEFDVIRKLIMERCTRLIVIISPSFFNSPANKFFVNFGQALGIERKQRKIIPCVYKHCATVPAEFTGYFMLDYSRAGKLWNYWDRLCQSIKIAEKEALPLKTSNSIPDERESQSTPRNLKLQSVLHRQGSSSLRPLSHSVKFNSMVNLSIPTEADKNTTTNESVNSLLPFSHESKVLKDKSKIGWLKKIRLRPKNSVKVAENKLPNGVFEKSKKSATGAVKKEKEKFWSKKKVQVAE